MDSNSNYRPVADGFVCGSGFDERGSYVAVYDKTRNVIVRKYGNGEEFVELQVGGFVGAGKIEPIFFKRIRTR